MNLSWFEFMGMETKFDRDVLIAVITTMVLGGMLLFAVAVYKPNVLAPGSTVQQNHPEDLYELYEMDQLDSRRAVDKI